MIQDDQPFKLTVLEEPTLILHKAVPAALHSQQATDALVNVNRLVSQTVQANASLDLSNYTLTQGKSVGRKKRKRTENADNLPAARSSSRTATRSASRLSIANQTEQVTLCAKVKKHFSELLGHILEKNDQNRIASIVSGSSKIEIDSPKNSYRPA